MNILLTSAGRRTYLVNYFKEAIEGNGKIFASNSIMTYTLTQADDYVITPNIYDDNYIQFLIDYCKQNNINCIIPLFDIDLPILSLNKSRFIAEGIFVIVSDLDVIDICNDKWKTYNYITSIGLLHPKTFLNINDTIIALSNREIKFPLIIKPRWGMGSIGIHEAYNIEDLMFYYKKVEKQIFETYLKYESGQDVNSCIVIQEKIIGSEYGLDIFNDFNGKNVTIIAKKKDAMRAGETDIATIIKDDELNKAGEIIALKLKHIGNLDTDCFISEDGYIYVLELNCRFGGQYPFSHIAGANFPKQIINWLNGEETSIELLQVKTGTTGYKELYPVKIPTTK